MYKILLADDEMLEREAIRYLLQNERYEAFDIIECNNGKDALRIILSEKPDISILDIQMPGFTGLEVLAKIRGMGFQGRVLFLTAFDSFDYAVRALKLQAQDFIVKPISEMYFYQVFDKLLDELDDECLDKAMEARKEALLKNMEKAFLKKMVLGDLDEEVIDFMRIQGMEFDISGNCFCVQFMEEIDKLQSVQMQETLKDKILLWNDFVMLNLQNKMMTLVCFSKNMEEEIDTTKIIEKCLQSFGMRFMIGAGDGFEDLSGIEECHDVAREKIGDIQPMNKERAIRKSTEETVGVDVPNELIKVRQYIDENYSKKITLEELAGIAGFTKCYLSRIYKKYYDENIMDYLIRRRMDKAKEMLVQEEKSVKQISMLVGFMEPNYFTWTFKKIVGETPLKYRQKHKMEIETENWNF